MSRAANKVHPFSLVSGALRALRHTVGGSSSGAGLLLGVACGVLGYGLGWTAAYVWRQRAPAREPSSSSLNLSERQVKAILFDLDGTLVETRDIWFEVLNKAAQHFGYPAIERKVWESSYGQPMEANVAAFTPGLAVQRLRDYVNEHYEDYLEALTVLPFAREVLSAANFHCPEAVAIVTNCPRPITELILREAKLEGLTTLVVCAGDAVETVLIPAHRNKRSSLSRTAGAVVGGSLARDDEGEERRTLRAKPAGDMLEVRVVFSTRSTPSQRFAGCTVWFLIPVVSSLLARV